MSIVPKRILIIKLRAIGDVVLATPVIENLKQHFPEAHLTFLTEEASAEVVRWNPFLDELIVLPLKSWKQLGFTKSWRMQIKFYLNLRRKRFDLVIDLFGNPRSALLTWLTGASERIGYDFRGRHYAYNRVISTRNKSIRHEVLFHLDSLSALDVPAQVRNPLVVVPKMAMIRAVRWLTDKNMVNRKIIGLNPGGGWDIKRWPPDKFGRLADLLINHFDVEILILWGPGEEQLVEEVVNSMKHSPQVLPQTTLLELAGYLQCCHLLISNDSGPMHIAAALDVTTIGIFWPTDPEGQGPWGNKHIVVQQDKVDCLGCNRTDCLIGNICLTTLEPEDVLAKIDASLPSKT